MLAFLQAEFIDFKNGVEESPDIKDPDRLNLTLTVCSSSSNEEPILQLKEISKRFGSLEALKSVNLAVSPGEFFGFLGPNGAGKSTLMKILSGFLAPDEGAVFLQGKSVKRDDREARQSCGLVPQEIALYDALNAIENLKVFGKLHDLSKRTIRDRGEHLLNEVGLWDRRNDRVKDFSGGMKRRLNIVVSLLHEPEILLCDEPTVGVDPQSRNAIFDFLEAQNQDGLTIVYTTHYMEEAERLCPRIAIIDHGVILACGEQEELLKAADCRQEIHLRKGGEIYSFESLLDELVDTVEDELLIRLLPRRDVALSRVFATLEKSGITGDRVVLRRPSLETLFLKLTGQRLRD